MKRKRENNITVLLKDANHIETLNVDKDLLIRISPHFEVQLELLNEGDAIFSKDEDAKEAKQFLTDVVKHYKKNQEKPKVTWSLFRSKLSTKWMIQDFVDAYALLIKTHLTEMSRPFMPKSYFLSGFSSMANGKYYRTSEMKNGLPVYKSETKWIMEYLWEGTNRDGWYVKKNDKSRQSSHYLKSPPVMPHHIHGNWINFNDMDLSGKLTLGYELTDPVALNTFWEMVELVFDNVAYRFKSPIKRNHDLITMLQFHPLLCVEEHMQKVMTFHDMFLLYSLVR